jgi:type I restriction enzyme R subunit
MAELTESVVEDAALAWLGSLSYAVQHGQEIAPGESGAERQDYSQVVLEERLRQALSQLSPELPAEALDEAFRKLTRAACRWR